MVAESDDPALAKRFAGLSAGGGRVCTAKLRELLQDLNTGFERRLSPGAHFWWAVCLVSNPSHPLCSRRYLCDRTVLTTPWTIYGWVPGACSECSRKTSPRIIFPWASYVSGSVAQLTSKRLEAEGYVLSCLCYRVVIVSFVSVHHSDFVVFYGVTAQLGQLVRRNTRRYWDSSFPEI